MKKDFPKTKEKKCPSCDRKDNQRRDSKHWGRYHCNNCGQTYILEEA